VGTYQDSNGYAQGFVATPSQTIIFKASSNQVFGGPPLTVSAAASSGLTVTFVSQTPHVCTVSGTLVTLVGVGACTIEARQAGNATYAAAIPVSQSFDVTQENQTITFGSPSNQPYLTAPFTVSATASSGLAVRFTSATTAVCAISEDTVTLLAVGKCNIRASQPGNVDYAAATAVFQSFYVTKASQTIAFGALSNQPLGPPFTISATASSDLPVSFTSAPTTVCTVFGNTVTLVAAGKCTIKAAQPGDADFEAAPSVKQSFLVTR
jgi:hypothetical protein